MYDRLWRILGIKVNKILFYYTVNPPITHLIRPALYRNRVKRNQNSVMETFVLYGGCPTLLSRVIWKLCYKNIVLQEDCICRNSCIVLCRNRVFGIPYYKRL